MGRRKKAEVWRGVEYHLLHEEEIRRTVKEERSSLSFVQSSGNGDGRGTKRADRTSTLAVKLATELPAIVLDDGQKIKRPESWIKVFDTVRKRAAKLDEAEDLLEFWAIRYGDGGGRFIDELISGRLDRLLEVDGYIMWIIENVEAEAIKRGLLDKEGALLYGRDLRFLETCKPRRID